MATAYISLGANVGDRASTLRIALTELARAGTVAHVSSLYETEPVGFLDQPRFLNAVVQIETSLAAPQLLDAMQEIERLLGRLRTFPNAPRTLDLDLLLYDDLVLESDRLMLPHPRVSERAFVLVPLVEIAPDLVHPVNGRKAAELLAGLPDRSGVSEYGRMAPRWPSVAATLKQEADD